MKKVSPKMLRRRIVTLLVVVFIIAMAVAFANSLSLLSRLRGEYAELQNQAAQQDLDLAILQEEVEYSKTDGYIKRMARELLGWVDLGDWKIIDESGE